MADLFEKLARRSPGICLYGLVPPKRATDATELSRIAARQTALLRALPINGAIVYDIQDESARTDRPRPFPFLPTIDPETYATVHLRGVPVPRIVYRAVHGSSREAFIAWLDGVHAASAPRAAVLVGAASSRVAGRGPDLAEAYALAREHAPHLVLGGIAIAERHARQPTEHERILAKLARGCRFLVTQAVYDVTSTKSLLSDLAIGLAESGRDPVPFIVTVAPCGSVKTLEFMKWLGIAFPRWLENDLRRSGDLVAKSVKLCEQTVAELVDYANEKGIPLGVNVESVSIRKAEIDASAELVHSLHRILTRAG